MDFRNDIPWGELKHAYHAADDIPALIEKFAQTGDPEALNDLWSALCHQGTIYTASLAAAPWLVQLVESSAITNPAWQFDVLDLAGSICLCSLRQDLPQVQPAIYVQYKLCLRRLPALLVSRITRELDRDHAQVLLGIVAALQGQTKLGFDLYDAAEEMECPNCDATFPRFYDLDEDYSHADESAKKE